MLTSVQKKSSLMWASSMLVSIVALSCASTPSILEITVDATQDVHPISPNIYGLSVSEGGKPYFKDMGISIVRWGGNARTRFNWEVNTSNAASDWEFRNLRKGDGVPGSAALDFHGRNDSIGATSVLTIPMIGWVASNGRNETRSVAVPAGAVNGYDPTENRINTSYASFARKDDPFVYPPDLEDKAVYQDEWVSYLTKTLGNAESTGIPFYEMDNEPMIWNSTHVDVHPEPLGYSEYLDLFLQYSNAVKDVDPTAQVLGPSVWGWTNYFYSALDQGEDNFNTAADRQTHGDRPFIPWFLGKVQENDTANGRRSLDVLSTHYYPQERVYSGDVSLETQARRLRSTRSLWDESYKDESWISNTDEGPVVQLIPRMRGWVDENYPGTKLAVTEWNWGAREHISGGLAAADVLGIFGREGVDLAVYWGEPGEGTPTYWAFRMFRNYDGEGNGFGDVSVNANNDYPDFVTTYASKSTETNEIKVLLINKSPNTTAEVQLNLNGAALNGDVSVHQYGAQSLGGIAQLPDVQLVESSLGYQLSPYSMTLFVADAQ